MASFDYLINEITLNAAVVSDFLKDNGHPAPTLAETSPIHFAEAPESVKGARAALIISLRELNQLASYSTDATKNVYFNTGVTTSLQFIVHFKIYDAVHLGIAISFEDLATKTSLPQQRLTHLMRLAMTRYIFHKSQPGYVSHSALSASLVESEGARNLAILASEAVFPAYSKLTEAVERYDDDEGLNNDPMALAIGQEGDTSFEALNRAGLVRVVASAIKGTKASEDVRPESVASGYNWAQFGGGAVVDVGGSVGNFSAAIAKKHPNLKFLVQDLPNEVERGRAELSPELQSHVSFTAHDFFKPNPFREASAFLMRYIIHDWPDKLAVQMLKGVVPAVGPRSKTIIVDAIMQEPGSVPRVEEAKFRDLDSVMMCIGGVERRDGPVARTVEEG